MTENNKIPVIAVVGPTASGKTELAVEIAKLYNGEIVSADSMQIYKGMKIATAKPDKDEMQGIKHYLIDFVEINEPFCAADYVKIAGSAVKEIYSKGKIPVVVGGTGLYVDSLLKNIQFGESYSDKDMRRELEMIYAEKGKEYLHNMLEEIDPEAAENIHSNNVIRVIRAIEICQTSGKTISEVKKESRSVPSPYDTMWIGIDFKERSVLYDRINKRVDKMIENGLIDEVGAVLEKGQLLTSKNAIGIKEWIPYFEGKASKEECIEKMKLETRHYAKRQLTWFRKNDEINWLIVDKDERIEKKLETCKKIIAKRKIM